MKKIICGLTFFLIVAHALTSEQLLIHVLRQDFLKLEDELWKIILSQNSETKVDPWITVVRKFYDFDQKVKQMPQDILHGMQVVREAKQFVFLYSDLRVVHDMYEKFRRYQITSLKPSKDYTNNKRPITTTDMVDDILYDENNNVNSTLQRIFETLFGSNTNNMIWDLFEIVSSNEFNCEHDQSSQQVFYNLYNVIALTELKGYAMMQFAYLSENGQDQSKNLQNSLVARERYKDRANNTMSTFRGTLEIMNGKIWKCDPNKHVKGMTFIEVTRLLQGHVQNEVDLNSRGTCRETCDKYTVSQNYGCYDSDSEYCRRRKPCNGRILNCRFIESHLKACIPVNSLRRYDYIEYKSGKVMGDKRRCSSNDVYSWFRWFVHCSYCMCLCDEQGPLSDRYFSTRPVMADIENNRVVTGLRIIKHNRIIHLQIQEGELLPYGYINNHTVRWVPVDDFKITDQGVKSGQDYHTMKYEERNILLDELASHESNHILTGVRFEYLDGFLRFQINVRTFDFNTGLLSRDSHYLYGSGLRNRINLDNSDIPIKAKKSEPQWGSNLYVQFTHTSFDKDVAQTTIPFIDSQPITNLPQVPLRGAGIYYKGSSGYGGFIAPSLTTYDFSKHMEMEFPDPKGRGVLVEYTEVEVN